MDDERQESSPLDEGSEMIAHSAQAAYAVSAAVKAGGTASGVAAGTAMAGPLGTLVGTLAGSKTVWKVFGAIFLFLFFVDVYYCKHDRNYIQLSGVCNRGFLCK